MAIFEDSGEEEAGARSIPWKVSSYRGKARSYLKYRCVKNTYNTHLLESIKKDLNSKRKMI